MCLSYQFLSLCILTIVLIRKADEVFDATLASQAITFPLDAILSKCKSVQYHKCLVAWGSLVLFFFILSARLLIVNGMSKNGFPFVLQFFSLISDGLGGVMDNLVWSAIGHNLIKMQISAIP